MKQVIHVMYEQQTSIVSKLLFLISIMLLLSCSCQNVTCPTTLYNTTTGECQTICCPVSRYPPPIATWKKKGTQLQRGRNTRLTMLLTDKQDFGMHTCIAVYFLGPCDIKGTKEDTVVDMERYSITCLWFQWGSESRCLYIIFS